MVRHIVMWKLSDYKEENLLKIREKLMALKGVVPQIKGKFEVVFGDKDYTLAHDGYHLALLADFDTIEDLGAYQVNPDHKAASAFVGSLVLTRACMDFEI